jgi:hypothetical protein
MTDTRANTVTVALADLHLALAAIIPFANEDGQSPGDFYALHLAAAGGQFTVSATDGYVAGRASKPASGQLDAPFHVARTHAQLLCSALEFHLDVLSTMPVTLTVTDPWPTRLLTICVDLSFTLTVYDQVVMPANMDRVFTTPPDETPAAPGCTPLSADRIAPFEHVATLAKGEPLRWTLYGPARRGYVRLGDWFTGVLRPVSPEAAAVTYR